MFKWNLQFFFIKYFLLNKMKFRILYASYIHTYFSPFCMGRKSGSIITVFDTNICKAYSSKFWEVQLSSWVGTTLRKDTIKKNAVIYPSSVGLVAKRLNNESRVVHLIVSSISREWHFGVSPSRGLGRHLRSLVKLRVTYLCG